MRTDEYNTEMPIVFSHGREVGHMFHGNFGFDKNGVRDSNERKTEAGEEKKPNWKRERENHEILS